MLIKTEGLWTPKLGKAHLTEYDKEPRLSIIFGRTPARAEISTSVFSGLNCKWLFAIQTLTEFIQFKRVDNFVIS